MYGGGKGTAEINQDLDWVPGSAEASDWFGEALATVDDNEDGYTDLVVGTPSEDLGTAADYVPSHFTHAALSRQQGGPQCVGRGIRCALVLVPLLSWPDRSRVLRARPTSTHSGRGRDTRTGTD